MPRFTDLNRHLNVVSVLLVELVVAAAVVLQQDILIFLVLADGQHMQWEEAMELVETWEEWEWFA